MMANTTHPLVMEYLAQLEQAATRLSPEDARTHAQRIGFCGVHFGAAVFQAGVARIWAALVADFAQAFGLNRQAKHFLFVWHQSRRQLHAVKVFGDERVVGRLSLIPISEPTRPY